MTTMEKARQVAAQAWCDPETSGKEMDTALAEAFALRLAVALDHLAAVTDIAIWMSGSNDFNPEGQAGAAWAKACPKVHAAARYFGDPAAAQTTDDKGPGAPTTRSEEASDDQK